MEPAYDSARWSHVVRRPRWFRNKNAHELTNRNLTDVNPISVPEAGFRSLRAGHLVPSIARDCYRSKARVVAGRRRHKKVVSGVRPQPSAGGSCCQCRAVAVSPRCTGWDLDSTGKPQLRIRRWKIPQSVGPQAITVAPVHAGRRIALVERVGDTRVRSPESSGAGMAHLPGFRVNLRA